MGICIIAGAGGSVLLFAILYAATAALRRARIVALETVCLVRAIPILFQKVLFFGKVKKLKLHNMTTTTMPLCFNLSRPFGPLDDGVECCVSRHEAEAEALLINRENVTSEEYRQSKAYNDCKFAKFAELAVGISEDDDAAQLRCLQDAAKFAKEAQPSDPGTEDLRVKLARLRDLRAQTSEAERHLAAKVKALAPTSNKKQKVAPAINSTPPPTKKPRLDSISFLKGTHSGDSGLILLTKAADITGFSGKANTIACYDAGCTGRAQIKGGSGKGRYRYECNICKMMWSQERDPRNGVKLRVSSERTKRRNMRYSCGKCGLSKVKHCKCKLL